MPQAENHFQEYVVFNTVNPAKSPLWMFNAALDDSGEWRFLPTRLLPPAAVPRDLMKHGAVVAVTGPSENVVASAIWAGQWMTVAQLRAARSVLNYPMPEEGSGANQNHIKIDFARAISKFLHPRASEEDVNRMVEGIMGGVKQTVRCPNKVLAALKGLSAEEKDGFEDLEMLVANQEKEQGPKKPRQASDRPDAYVHLHSTHPAVRSLVPNAPGYGCSRNPALQRYYAWVPRVLSILPGKLFCFFFAF